MVIDTTGQNQPMEQELESKDKVFCMHLISLIMLNIARNTDTLVAHTPDNSVTAQRSTSTKKLIALVFDIIKILNI